MTEIGPFGPSEGGFSRQDTVSQVDPTFRRSDPVNVTPPLLGGAELAEAAGGGGLSTLAAGAGVLQIAGLVTRAIGAFYEAESQKYKLESDELTLRSRQKISSINARVAEADAAAIFEAGRRRRAQVTLRFGQIKGRQRVSAAARGVQAGVGSAAELLASTELATEVDAYAIDANTFRAASAARRRAVSFRSEALLTGVSAENVRGTRRGISPLLAAGTTFLGGAANVATDFAQRSRS